MKLNRLTAAAALALTVGTAQAQQQATDLPSAAAQMADAMAQVYISVLSNAADAIRQQASNDTTAAAAASSTLSGTATRLDSAMEKNMSQMADAMGQMASQLTQVGHALGTCAQQMGQTAAQSKQIITQGAKAQSDALFDMMQQMLGQLKAATDAALEELGEH